MGSGVADRCVQRRGIYEVCIGDVACSSSFLVQVCRFTEPFLHCSIVPSKSQLDTAGLVPRARAAYSNSFILVCPEIRPVAMFNPKSEVALPCRGEVEPVGTYGPALGISYIYIRIMQTGSPDSAQHHLSEMSTYMFRIEHGYEYGEDLEASRQIPTRQTSPPSSASPKRLTSSLSRCASRARKRSTSVGSIDCDWSKAPNTIYYPVGVRTSTLSSWVPEHLDISGTSDGPPTIQIGYCALIPNNRALCSEIFVFNGNRKSSFVDTPQEVATRLLRDLRSEADRDWEQASDRERNIYGALKTSKRHSMIDDARYHRTRHARVGQRVVDDWTASTQFPRLSLMTETDTAKAIEKYNASHGSLKPMTPLHYNDDQSAESVLRDLEEEYVDSGFITQPKGWRDFWNRSGQAEEE